MKLKFSDGMEIDTSGPYRIIHESDGYYVVGRGFMSAVKNREEGEKLLRELKERNIRVNVTELEVLIQLIGDSIMSKFASGDDKEGIETLHNLKKRLQEAIEKGPLSRP